MTKKVRVAAAGVREGCTNGQSSAARRWQPRTLSSGWLEPDRTGRGFWKINLAELWSPGGRRRAEGGQSPMGGWVGGQGQRGSDTG